jgi:hypothetical protein
MGNDASRSAPEWTGRSTTKSGRRCLVEAKQLVEAWRRSGQPRTFKPQLVETK